MNLGYQPKLLAVCSRVQNKISIYDLQNNQKLNTFDGAKIQKVDEGCKHKNLHFNFP